MDYTIRPASQADVPAIVTVVNKAFDVERFFKDGDRTNFEDIKSHMMEGTFLVAREGTELVACVYVRIREGRGYIGLLSVDPARQGSGLGSVLMQRAEEYCAAAGCKGVDLRLVNLRTELLAYYGKRGYVQCRTESAQIVKGATQPIHFVVMSKELG
jgi:predicted N-acetyltransferase YhbS